MDVNGLNQSDRVVAIMDGCDPDSGTCWECGYAYAKGKPIIVVRTDFRGVGEAGLCPYNIMPWQSATRQLQLSCLQYDLPSIANAIHQSLNE